MSERVYHVKNDKTGEIVKTTNPLSVVQHLQKKKAGVLDLTINLYEAFNKEYSVVAVTY